MRIGTNELLIILAVALLIFGPKNLPKLGKMFGKTINGFKKGMEEAGIRNQVKVMIGGAPVSQGFADEIGADGYSDNANTAVAVAKELIGNKK